MQVYELTKDGFLIGLHECQICQITEDFEIKYNIILNAATAEEMENGQ